MSNLSQTSSVASAWERCEDVADLERVDKPEAGAADSFAAVPDKVSDPDTLNLSPVDLSVWLNAPQERTIPYFPTYSTVSKAIQTTLRGWVRDWFYANPEILLRPQTAHPILVYQCTHPFSGRPTNMFTYDIQQTEALNRAFASAAYRLGRELKALDTKRLPWLTREHYFAYRSKEVIKFVARNRRALYKMLNVETVLMDSILKFAVIDIPKIGLEEASVPLRRAFRTQLGRFSTEFDFTPRAEELLGVATDALTAKLAGRDEPDLTSSELPISAETFSDSSNLDAPKDTQ